MIGLLLHLVQVTAPTVGDTIWVERSVRLPPGAQVRAAEWPLEGDLVLLGPPLLTRLGDQATVRYPLVAWRAGDRSLTVPGPIVIRADGTTDSLPPEVRTLTVASVLPADRPVETLPVQPEAGLVRQRITSPWPVLAALALATGLWAPVAWWWRRRGPKMPLPAGPASLPRVPLSEWQEAGEYRAVAAVVSRNLRLTIQQALPAAGVGLVTGRLIRVIREQRPAWPVADLASVLRGLDEAQFGLEADDGLGELVDRASALQASLEAGI